MTLANKHIKKCSVSSANTRVKIKVIMRFHFILTSTKIIK